MSNCYNGYMVNNNNINKVHNNQVEKVKVKVEPVDEQPLHRQSRVSPRIKIEDTPPKAEIKVQF